MRTGPAVLASVLVFCSLPAHAETDVFGRINREMRWTLDGSPYRLVGDVNIGPNGLVLVDAGVEVVAIPEEAPGEGEDPTRVELVIEGRLVARGTVDAPVVFRPHAPDAEGGWRGLRLEGDGTVRLEHAQLLGTVRAIDGRSTFPPEALSTATFRRCQTGLYWASAADLDLRATAIHGDCARAIDVVPLEGVRRALVRVRDSVLSGGVLIAGTQTVVVSGSEVHGGTDGVSISGADDVRVEGTYVELNEGILIRSDGPAVVARGEPLRQPAVRGRPRSRLRDPGRGRGARRGSGGVPARVGRGGRLPRAVRSRR